MLTSGTGVPRASFRLILSNTDGGVLSYAVLPLTLLETLGKTIRASCMSCINLGCLSCKVQPFKSLAMHLAFYMYVTTRTVHPQLQDGCMDGCKNHAMHLAFYMYVTCNDSPPSIA